MSTYTELAQISCNYFPAGYEFPNEDMALNKSADIDSEEMCYPKWEDSIEKMANGCFEAKVPIYSFRVEPFGQCEAMTCLEFEYDAIGNDIYLAYLREWASTIDRLFKPKERTVQEMDFHFGQFVGVFKTSYWISRGTDGDEHESEVSYEGVLDMSKLEMLKESIDYTGLKTQAYLSAYGNMGRPVTEKESG